MTPFNESTVEQAAMEWLSDLGWETAYGPDIAPGTPAAERDNYTEVVLERRLRDALERLNPYLEDEALETALRRITNPDGPTQEARNRFFHLDLINGITVERRGLDGTVSGVPAKIIDFEDPHKNDWLAVNQFTVQGNQQPRRLDIVLFVNGLPLGNIELKNPADESTDIWEAWDQFQTYQAELLDMFSMNEVQIISDGILARIGPLNAGKEWFKPWRTMESEEGQRSPSVGVTGNARRDLRSRQVPHLRKGFHRLRQRRQREADKEAGRLPPVARRPGCRGGNPQGHSAPERGCPNPPGRAQPTRRGAWRPAHRSRLAQPGVRQEPDHGVLHRRHRPGTGDGKPDHRGPHRPERPGWPTLRDLLPVQRPAQAGPSPGGEQGRPPQ